MTLKIPPLRMRPRDIWGLIHIFGKKKDYNFSIPQEYMSELYNRKWTGNVRELSAFVTRLGLISGLSGPTEMDINMALDYDTNDTDLDGLEFHDYLDKKIYDALNHDQTGKAVYTELKIP